MKRLTIASALLTAIAFVPTGAFANYYGYNRCMNGGGNWFSCLGELADVSIQSPELKEQFGFFKAYKEEAVVTSLKKNSEMCDKQKGKEKAACYLEGLKKDLK